VADGHIHRLYSYADPPPILSLDRIFRWDVQVPALLPASPVGNSGCFTINDTGSHHNAFLQRRARALRSNGSENRKSNHGIIIRREGVGGLEISQVNGKLAILEMAALMASCIYAL